MIHKPGLIKIGLVLMIWDFLLVMEDAILKLHGTLEQIPKLSKLFLKYGKLNNLSLVLIQSYLGVLGGILQAREAGLPL